MFVMIASRSTPSNPTQLKTIPQTAYSPKGAWPIVDSIRLLAVILLSIHTVPALAQLQSIDGNTDGGTDPPNIVLIMADDLGYGDLSCYGATKFKTPNIDKLATQGMQFNNYYTSGSVCIPTRYSMMTGRYPCRNADIGKKHTLLLNADSETIGTVCQRAGYRTAAIGKWHIGYGDGKDKDVDWGAILKPGPLQVGFNYHWGIAQNHNDLTRTYVDNQRLTQLDPNGGFRIGQYDQKARTLKRATKGVIKERQDDKVNALLTEKATEFIRANKDEPFFVYFTPTIPHTHITPDVQFRGTSDAGLYGDFVQELDYHVGRILALLDELKLSDNTLVIITSDNGGQLNDHWTAGIGLNVADDSGDVVEKSKTAKKEARTLGHRVNRHLRSGKGSQYEGGFNVPLIIRWPGKVAPGTRSDKIICSSDHLMTFAGLLNVPVGQSHAGDSFSYLDLLNGSTVDRPRRDIVLDRGKIKAYRVGDWKLIHYPNKKQTELFNLAKDPSETKNLVASEPERVSTMTAALMAIVNAKGHRFVHQ